MIFSDLPLIILTNLPIKYVILSFYGYPQPPIFMEMSQQHLDPMLHDTGCRYQNIHGKIMKCGLNL